MFGAAGQQSQNNKSLSWKLPLSNNSAKEILTEYMWIKVYLLVLSAKIIVLTENITWQDRNTQIEVKCT